MDTLIAIGEDMIDFVVGVISMCLGKDLKWSGKGKKKKR